MSWSYDPTLSIDKDRVRFLLQDTDESRQVFQDEEITWVVSQEANVYLAAAVLCDLIITKLRAVSSKSVGGLSISYRSTSDWEAASKRLRLRGATYQSPSAGGVFIADRDAIWEDSDLLRPSFFDELHQDKTALGPQRSSDLVDEEP